MNNEIIISLQTKVDELSNTIHNIEKTVNGLKINDQYSVTCNQPIPPGIACKVAYDSNGLIKKGIGLEVTDIPQLDIDKIINLKSYLDNKASLKDLDKFKDSISEMIKPTVSSITKIAGTGTKVNYNSDGRIISTSDLLPSDIPLLPISKIDGLSDLISNISTIDSSNEDDIPNIKVTPGDYLRVTIDKYGRVISGSNLEMKDIPSELVSKVNMIESKLINLPSQQIISNIQESLIKKLDSNKAIIPGTFTKIKVDSKGLVTFGDKLTIKDLPELNISDITNLDKIIKNKVDRSEFIELSDSVSTILRSINNIGEIMGIKNELNTKATDEDVKKIESRVKTIQDRIDSLVNIMPSDTISMQLDQIMDELSKLSGRISVIEKTINLV